MTKGTPAAMSLLYPATRTFHSASESSQEHAAPMFCMLSPVVIAPWMFHAPMLVELLTQSLAMPQSTSAWGIELTWMSVNTTIEKNDCEGGAGAGRAPAGGSITALRKSVAASNRNAARSARLIGHRSLCAGWECCLPMAPSLFIIVQSDNLRFWCPQRRPQKRKLSD